MSALTQSNIKEFFFAKNNLLGLIAQKALKKQKHQSLVKKITEEYKKAPSHPSQEQLICKDTELNISNLFLKACFYGLEKETLLELFQTFLGDVFPSWLESCNQEDWNQSFYYYQLSKNGKAEWYCPTVATFLFLPENFNFIFPRLKNPQIAKALSVCKSRDIIWHIHSHNEYLVKDLLNHHIYPEFFNHDFLSPAVTSDEVFYYFVPQILELAPRKDRNNSLNYVLSALYMKIAILGDEQKWNFLQNLYPIDFSILETVVIDLLDFNQTYKAEKTTLKQCHPDNNTFANLYYLIQDKQKEQMNAILFENAQNHCLNENNLKNFLLQFFDTLPTIWQNNWLNKIYQQYPSSIKYTLCDKLFNDGLCLDTSLFGSMLQAFKKRHYSQEHIEHIIDLLYWTISQHYIPKLFKYPEEQQINILFNIISFNEVNPCKHIKQKNCTPGKVNYEELEEQVKTCFIQTFLINHIDFFEFKKDVLEKDKSSFSKKYEAIYQHQQLKKKIKKHIDFEQKISKHVLL